MAIKDWNGFKKGSDTYIPNDTTARAGLQNKVDKVQGKGLSTNDYDDTEKAKVAGAFPRSEQAVLGAKNWFNKNKTPDSTGNYAISTPIETGIRVTNTQSATWSTVRYRIPLLKNTNYIIRFNAVITSGNSGFLIRGSNDNGSTWTNLYDTGSGVTSCNTVFNSKEFTTYELLFYCARDVSADGDVSYNKLMIYLASDPDDTYADYAMTNKELTEKVQGIINAATNAADFAAFKTAIGNL